jgi:hypothetical protein
MNIYESLKRVNKTIKNNANELSLFNLKLDDSEFAQLIAHILEIKRLNYLFLKNSKLANYDFLKKLTSLIQLDLSNNGLTNIKSLAGLVEI